MNRALPPGNRGHRSRNSSGKSGSARTLFRAFGLVGGVAAAAPRGKATARNCKVIKHGGFARFWRETPCAITGTRKRTEDRMLLIDSRGQRPVCIACHKLGPYGNAERGVFICEACVRAADVHLQKLAESVPELRDHRLKRWRKGCDCDRCRKRHAIA